MFHLRLPPQYLAEVDPGRQQLLENVKNNTMRYIGIAAEAADEAMPPPEGLPQADIFDRLLESVSRAGGGGGMRGEGWQPRSKGRGVTLLGREACSAGGFG